MSGGLSTDPRVRLLHLPIPGHGVGMSRINRTVDAAVSAVVRAQDGLIRRDQALAAGLSAGALTHRLHSGRDWRRLLPGVYATFTGEPTERQRQRAALLYAGPQSVLGGPTAARLHDLRTVPADDNVHVLLPMAVRRMSSGFVVVRHTITMPWTATAGGLAVAPVPRAVIDTCLGLRQLHQVRAVIAEAVQRGLTNVDRLIEELEHSCSAGSAFPREVLDEVADGVRSAPEAANRALILRSRVLPRPLFNCRLYGPDGRWLADPDVYWVDAGVVEEIDSAQWHLSPARWEATMARHARMEAVGLHVIHVPPSRVMHDRPALLAELERAYVAALRTGPPPGIRAVPHTVIHSASLSLWRHQSAVDHGRLVAR